MNTYTSAVHPEEKLQQIVRKNLFHNKAIKAIVLVLTTIAVIAIYLANQPVVVAENNAAVPYSNALEMQYARPWLEAQNKSVVEYSNALELQYAQPWIESQSKPAISYSNALEMQYAQPWLDKKQNLLNCDSSAELFYACKYGYGRP